MKIAENKTRPASAIKEPADVCSFQFDEVNALTVCELGVAVEIELLAIITSFEIREIDAMRTRCCVGDVSYFKLLVAFVK
jgi:hypothetical protein